MRLVELLLKDTRTSVKRLGLMAVVAGAASAGILAIVNAAAQTPKDFSGHFYFVVLFGIALVTYVLSQKYVLVVTTDEVERIVDMRRRNLLRKLVASGLAGVEKIGHGVIFTAINTDAQTISQTAGSLMLGVQALILMFWTALYLATLSMPTLGLVALVLLIASRIYKQKIAHARRELRGAHQEVTALHEIVEGLLGGFKEAKLSSRRAEALLNEAVSISERTAYFRSRAQRALAANFIFSQLAIFVLLGTLVFILPVISTTFAGTTVKSLTAVLFLVGPISGIISSVPQITMANAAAENLLALERLLDKHAENPPDENESIVPAWPNQTFKTLELRQLYFSRGQGLDNFTVGPIDLTIHAGETIFITGGNGSGKTTFIKMLTGLYPVDSGDIVIDNRLITKNDMQHYRDMFAAVFADFHLFDKLYGIDRVDKDRGAELITHMELDHKITLDAERFSTVDLSTGQRKRLALVAAELEDKPILILDEWAADQDPHFRQKFYENLLPRLKAHGTTVIAITHDDKYFHFADRRLHMEDGRINEVPRRMTAHG